MPGQELRFEYRIAKILEAKRYLVINCARSKPFDLIAIKNQIAYPIELKGKDTRYPPEQMEAQLELCAKANSGFIVIRQSKKRGKIRLEHYPNNKIPIIFTSGEDTFRKDLEEYLDR